MAYERYLAYLSDKLKRLDKKKLQPHQNLLFLEHLMHQVKAMILYIKILKKKKHQKTEQLVEEQKRTEQFYAKMMQHIKEEQKKASKVQHIEPIEIQISQHVTYQYRLNIRLTPGIPKDVLYNELAAFQFELLALRTNENQPVYKSEDLDFVFIDEPEDTISFRFSNKITAEMFIERLLVKAYIIIPDAELHQGLSALFKELQPESSLKNRLGNLFGLESCVKSPLKKP